MHPELFDIPFIHISVKSYGTLVVIGFLLAVWLMRRMAKRAGQNPEWIASAAMYALIAGFVGAKLFHVAHYYEQFRHNFSAIFSGSGFEFLGGVLTAIVFLLVYFYLKKLPFWLYLDMLAVGLMVGLGFGRIGCLMNGCCYGKITDVPWAIHFPYKSPVFYGQAHPNPERGRPQPQLNLPESYFQDGFLKPYEKLTPEQKEAVTTGPLCVLPVHPTQIYSSINAFLLACVLYAVWRKLGQIKPGVTMSLTMVLYGITRFFLETLRDDNPFEYAWWTLYKGGTVSQNICIYLILAGVFLLVFMMARKPSTWFKHSYSKPAE
jgi:phosphatidylglycerol:prolipoprotein diacylglycerol transferase